MWGNYIGALLVRSEYYNYYPYRGTTMASNWGWFNNEEKDTVRLFLKDSLLTEWHGPPREMEADNNHFFNYNSWKHFDEPDTSFYSGGALVFTFSESDFGHLDE